MGLSFRKRINLGKGFGLNISRKGISPSFRSKTWSIGPRGLSVKTGVPGIRYRKSFKGSGAGCLVAMLAVGLLAVAISCCRQEPHRTPASATMATVASIPSDTSRVFVCKSAAAARYHFDRGCRGLRRCTHIVVAMSVKDAEEAGLGLCGYEKARTTDQ